MAGGPQRNFGLDALRCVAIVMVLANHAFLGFFVELGDIPWAGALAFASIVSFISIEWLFVLSGFLIGAMMIRSFEKPGTWRQRAGSFWVRRWFRTLPNYYLFLVVNILVASLAQDARFSWRFVVFAQNLAWPEPLPLFFNEAWSLALDEWFYLIMPILVGVAARLLGAGGRHAFLAATATLILVPTTLRLLAPMPATPFDWDLGIRRVTIYHLDATGWGVLAALTSRWFPTFWSRRIGAKAALGATLMLAGVLSIVEMFFQFLAPEGLGWAALTWWPRLPVAFGLTFTGIGTFLAFPWIAALRAPATAWRHGVERISNYTYSIYLSHFPLLYILAAVMKHQGWTQLPVLWLGVAVWLALVLGVSAATFRWFEKPVSDLRDRFTRKVDASPFHVQP